MALSREANLAYQKTRGLYPNERLKISAVAIMRATRDLTVAPLRLQLHSSKVSRRKLAAPAPSLREQTMHGDSKSVSLRRSPPSGETTADLDHCPAEIREIIFGEMLQTRPLYLLPGQHGDLCCDFTIFHNKAVLQNEYLAEALIRGKGKIVAKVRNFDFTHVEQFINKLDSRELRRLNLYIDLEIPHLPKDMRYDNPRSWKTLIQPHDFPHLYSWFLAAEEKDIGAIYTCTKGSQLRPGDLFNWRKNFATAAKIEQNCYVSLQEQKREVKELKKIAGAIRYMIYHS